MSFRKELLKIGGWVVCILAIAALTFAAASNPADAATKSPFERQLSQEFTPLGSVPVNEVNPAQAELSGEKASAMLCTGQWMGVRRYAINTWFTGQEYYAVYQDPLETGCPGPITYPFRVDRVVWELYNTQTFAVTINIQPMVWTVDNSVPACRKPGRVCCYGPVYSVTLNPMVVSIITMAMDSGCCMSGPYFAGAYCPDLIGLGVLDPVTDSAGATGPFGKRACANYNNYAGAWEDLIVTSLFPGNLRLWSEGTTSDVNNCNPCATIIEPGVDLWTTPLGSSFDKHFTVAPLPASFFNPGSDPFADAIPLQGSPLTTTPAGALGLTDCVVRRPGGPLSLPMPGSSGAVPIEIVALNLVSVNPITVRYSSGPDEQWNVQVTLSTQMPQQMGQMTIRKVCCNGGTFDSQLPVMPKFIFTQVGSPSNIRVLDLGGMMPPIMFQSTGGHWSHDIPAPFDLQISPGLVAVDNDLNNGTPDVLIDPSSCYTPGLRSIPCLPNPPDLPYCGGKVLTLEQEQLAQHGVLPVQHTTPVEGACCLPDGSCIVTDPACCQQNGGSYLGDFTTCPPDCTPDTICDTLCSNATLTVTLNPGDPACQNAFPPVTLTQVSGFPLIVCYTPGPPYIPGQIIQTELIQMELQGTSIQMGPVRLHQSPIRRSFGQITVLNTDGVGNLINGDSFFDVFFEVDLPMFGGSAHNQNSVRMQAAITALPPSAGTNFQMAPQPPVMLFQSPAGPQVGFLCNAIHRIIQCGPPPCCIPPLRGDMNYDGADANILDLTFAVDRIFRGGPPPQCPEEGDPNSDQGVCNILDLTYLVDRIFRGGPAPHPC